MPKAIKTLTDGLALPTPISSRFCEWMDANPEYWPGWRVPANLRLYAAVIGAFPDPEGHIADNDGLFEGDPRRHQTQEISFVAIKEGLLGIHLEQELNFILADESDLHDGDRLVDAEEFADLEKFWAAKLQRLADKYANTEFFLAHGEHTYKGRMTLNAWTPFINQPDLDRPADEVKLGLQKMLSPYQDPHPAYAGDPCPTIEELADNLMRVSFHEDLKVA